MNSKSTTKEIEFVLVSSSGTSMEKVSVNVSKDITKFNITVGITSNGDYIVDNHKTKARIQYSAQVKRLMIKEVLTHFLSITN